MEDFNTFRAKTIKLYGSRNIKVTNSYGTKQVWRWLKKNKWFGLEPITERDFGKIIRTINTALVEKLLKGQTIMLPCNMGNLAIRKSERKIKIKDGKVITNLPIDWKRTLQLWYEDSEAKANKVYIRHEVKELFSIVYSKGTAKYKNKVFYTFTPIRSIKKELSRRVQSNELDAFLFIKK